MTAWFGSGGTEGDAFFVHVCTCGGGGVREGSVHLDVIFVLEKYVSKVYSLCKSQLDTPSADLSECHSLFILLESSDHNHFIKIT